MKDAWLQQLQRFYEEHRQGLYTYALSLTRCAEAAEDAIQDAFAKMLRTAAPTELRPYVFRCVRNAAIDQHRKSIRTDELIIDTPAAGTDQPRDFEPLARAMGRLSDEQRETIVLRIYEDMSFREIAEMREASINTVASWYRRGLEQLRHMMESEQ